MLLRRFGWPLGPLPLVGVAAVSAVLTFLTSRPGADYALWVDTTTRVHESVGVVSAVVALVAAWTGHALGRSGAVHHGAGVGSRGRQLAMLVLALTTAALLGIAVGLTPLLWWTSRTATWGSLDPLGPVMAVAGIALVVVASVALGALVDRAAWCVAIAAAVAVVLWVPASIDRAFTVVSPVWDWQPGARFSTNPAPVVYFLAFAAVVAAGFAVVFMARAQRGSRLALTGLLATGAFLFVLPLAWRPDLFVLRSDPAPTCSVVADAQVCVHPANAEALERVESGVQEVDRLLGMPAAQRVTDLNTSATLDPGADEVLTAVGPGYTPEEAETSLVRHVSGLDVCDARFPVVADAAPRPEHLASMAVAATMFERLGREYVARDLRLIAEDEATFDAFASMPADRFRSFVADHRTALSACSAVVNGEPE